VATKGITLRVKGIPRTASRSDVAAFFTRFGATLENVRWPRDRKTYRKRDFVYVDVPDAAQAESAIRLLHGTPIGTSALEVTRYEPPVQLRPPPVRRRP
jgi:RNA recognition motif-containing protein